MQYDIIFIKLKNYTIHHLGINANMIKLYVKSKAMTSLKIQGEAYLRAEMGRSTEVGARLFTVGSRGFIIGLSYLHISY